MSTRSQALNNKAYNTSANQFAGHFAGHGARTRDIERALELAGNSKAATVIEIGCGDGRDAVEIIKRVANYQGFDPSRGMLRLAKEKLPKSSFINATASSFSYPSGTVDVVYAFASLLHIPKEELSDVFMKVNVALRPGGVFYISTKEHEEYKEELKKDKFGERVLYFYNANILSEYAGNGFEKAYEDHQILGDAQWITLALRKK